MVDSVRFPPSIGGSGRTYTNDANPETGMFNGGHRSNFFPMQADAAAAAGYVSRYAQAIDGAKGNADRAESAQQYVKTVADAYRVNIRDGYKERATLVANFRAGEFKSDDGEDVRRPLFGELFSQSRATPLNVEGLDGFIRAVSPGDVPRQFRRGNPDGLLNNASVTNICFPSSDFSRNWVKTSATGFDYKPDQVAPDGTTGCYLTYRLIDALPQHGYYFYRSIQLDANTRYCHSVYFKPTVQVGIFRLYLHANQYGDNSGRAEFDLATKTLTSSTIPRSDMGVEELENGWYRMWVSGVTSDTLNSTYTLLIWPTDIPNGEGFFIWNGQVVKGRSPQPPIPTESAPVSIQGNRVETDISGLINLTSFTWFMEISNLWGASEGALWSLSPQHTADNVRLRLVTAGNGRLAVVQIRDEEGNYSGFITSREVSDRVRVCIAYVSGILRVVIDGQVAFRGAQTLYPSSHSLISGGKTFTDASNYVTNDMFLLAHAISEQEMVELTQ